MPEELRQQSPEQRLGPQTVEFYRPRQIQLQSPGTAADSEPFEARGGDFDDEVNELDRLASLSPLEYDRERMDAAERLSVRVGTLDREVQLRRATAPDSEVVGSGTPVEIADPEAWPSAVSGSSLLDELIAVVRKYVHMKEESALAVALWVLHAHAHNAAKISPILSITSPVLGCGKTTVLALLGALCPRPLSASNITTAALFRSVERWKPTLLVDEADTFLKKSDEMRGVLNSGHTRFNAYVIRTVGEDHEPRLFGTWAPKAIALIGALPDTLASRAIEIRMRRLARGESVDELRPDRLEHLEPLRRQAWQWVQDNLHELRPADPVVPLTVLGRAADNWRPCSRLPKQWETDGLCGLVSPQKLSSRQEMTIRRAFSCSLTFETSSAEGSRPLVVRRLGLRSSVYGGPTVAGMARCEAHHHTPGGNSAEAIRGAAEDHPNR